MVPKKKQIANPIDLLDSTLEQVWMTVCKAFDVDGPIPNTQALFANAQLNTPPQAAEAVLVNMLTEVIERVARFSPWYKMPARAFGLASVRHPQTGVTRWLLAPEALQRWTPTLNQLAQAIRLNAGLIQATLVVENISGEDLLSDPQVLAECDCMPPRRIQIGQSILDKTAIICDECLQPFR